MPGLLAAPGTCMSLAAALMLHRHRGRHSWPGSSCKRAALVVLILLGWQLLWLPVLQLVWVGLAEAQQLVVVLVLALMEAKRVRPS